MDVDEWNRRAEEACWTEKEVWKKKAYEEDDENDKEGVLVGVEYCSNQKTQGTSKKVTDSYHYPSLTSWHGQCGT